METPDPFAKYITLYMLWMCKHPQIKKKITMKSFVLRLINFRNWDDCELFKGLFTKNIMPLS